MRQDLVGKRASPERRVSEGERYITAHRRAADPRIGALRERRATDRRVSVPAASNRAASAAKAGVGPFQRSSFTSSRGSVGIVSEYSSRLTEESHHLGDGRLIPILFGCSRVIANSRGRDVLRLQLLRQLFLGGDPFAPDQLQNLALTISLGHKISCPSARVSLCVA